MTETPTLEKIQGSRCNTCLHDCDIMCGTCGATFCTRHMLVHTRNCNNYRAVVRAILWDGLRCLVPHACEAILRAM